ncbi:MAG: type III polyketide synthase [Gemmatimonadales bacterium]
MDDAQSACVRWPVKRPIITRVATAYPPYRVSQVDVGRHSPALFERARHAELLARASQIDERAIALPLDELRALGSIEERNRIYARLAPVLALRAAEQIAEHPEAIDCVVTSSCTGYSVPGWNVSLARGLHMRDDVARVPITEAGCAGGVVALARVADFVSSRGRGAGMAVAAELCSLAFHSGGDASNYVASLIFADGAGAACVEMGSADGFEIVDALSEQIPKTEGLLGFDLTDAGFYPVLSNELTDVLAAAMPSAVQRLLGRNGLARADVAGWLLHPGGARILARLESALELCRAQTRWAWDSMRAHGNTSSASIFNVIARALAEPASGNWHIAAAFGPGVSVELLLLRRIG